jgi:large conductance mechanosensitive channel protein
METNKQTETHTEEINVPAANETIEIKETTSTHHSAKSTVAVIVNSDLNPVNGFLEFLREHAVVGLAIGFVIGTQVQSVVKQLVSSFISPLFTLFLGKSIETRSFSLTYEDRIATFPWGAFIYGLLNFLFVVIAIYLIVKILKLDKLDKPVEKTSALEKAEVIEHKLLEGQEDSKH